jgi:hypothetical protein
VLFGASDGTPSLKLSCILFLDVIITVINLGGLWISRNGGVANQDILLLLTLFGIDLLGTSLKPFITGTTD